MKWLRECWEEIKHHWKEEHERLEKDLFKIWQVKYGDHMIRIENYMNEEKLYVDGQLMDHKKRKHPLAQVGINQTLQAQLTDNNGEKAKIEVTLGGLITLNCIVRVNDEVIFRDKYRISLF